MSTFPLVPNWAGGFRETLMFKTDVFQTDSGYEQRRSLQSVPKTRFEFDALSDEDRLKTFMGFMQTNFGKAMHLPDYTRLTRVTAAAAASATTLQVSETPAWLIAGSVVCLQIDRRVYDATVSSITGTTLTLSQPLGVAVYSGTRIRPRLAGRIRQSNEFAIVSPNVVTPGVNFEVDANAAVSLGGVFRFSDYLGYFYGRELLLNAPNLLNRPEISFIKETTTTLDYGNGPVSDHSPNDIVTRTLKVTLLGKTLLQSDELRNFFLRQKGSLKEFFVASQTHDMEPLDAFSDATNVIVSGRDVYDFYRNDPTHRAFVIKLKSGDAFTFRTTGFSLLNDNTVLSTQGFPFEIPVSEILGVSWLYQVRFQSDDLTIEWLTDTVTQMTFTFRILPFSAPDDDLLSDYSDAEQWMIDTFGWIFSKNVLIDTLDYSLNATAWGMTSGFDVLGTSLQIALKLWHEASDGI